MLPALVNSYVSPFFSGHRCKIRLSIPPGTRARVLTDSLVLWQAGRAKPHRNEVNKNSMRRGVLISGLLWIGALFGSGCIVPSQEAIRNDRGPLHNLSTSQAELRTESGSLIKPSIPREVAPASQAAKTTEHGSVNPEPAAQMPAVNTDNPFAEKPEPKDQQPELDEPLQPPGGQSGPAEQEWEDQKVRDAAVVIAKASPEVQKIKICYAVKQHEWWVILYERGQGFFELKQYIWNKETEKLEPYLVLKRIPATRLQQHLTEEEPGKACEILEPPSPGPGGPASGPGA
jgi:hypothetical protein